MDKGSVQTKCIKVLFSKKVQKIKAKRPNSSAAAIQPAPHISHLEQVVDHGAITIENCGIKRLDFLGTVAQAPSSQVVFRLPRWPTVSAPLPLECQAMALVVDP